MEQVENLMILGANVLQIPLIQQAHKSGYYTIVVSPQKNEPGFKYADLAVYADVRDEATVLDYARKYKIAGIVTDQTDLPVRTAAYVAEQMGLPGIGYDTACLFTDKYLMREKCRELGIPTLKYKKVNNVNDAIEFFQTLDGDAILKPVDNQGSKGVLKVSSNEELMAKFNLALEYSKSGSVLVEQFVTGREFVVEGLAFNYRFENLVCGDTHYFDIPDVFSATTRVFPSKADHELVKRVKKLNQDIITGFGLKQGITHSEFIVTRDNIYLIETAARGGGVFISSDVIPVLTGINTEKFLIGIATGTQKEPPVVCETGRVCCYIAFYLPVGEIVSLDGVERVKNLSFVHRHNLDEIHIGMKTSAFTDKTSRKFVVVSADNHNQLEERVEFIRTTLKIGVLTEQGVERPIWK